MDIKNMNDKKKHLGATVNNTATELFVKISFGVTQSERGI